MIDFQNILQWVCVLTIYISKFIFFSVVICMPMFQPLKNSLFTKELKSARDEMRPSLYMVNF